MKRTRTIGIAAVIAFAVCQTGPALGYGPYEGLGVRTSINPMVYFRVPLGVSKAERDRTASFGVTVKNEFQFAHPTYQGVKGAYPASTSFDLMGFRFGMNGKLIGVEVGGSDALGTKPRLDTVTGPSSGTN